MSEHFLSRPSPFEESTGSIRVAAGQGPEIHTPTESLELIAEAAFILRANPDATITFTDPIPEAWGTSGDIVRDILAQTQKQASVHAPQAVFASQTEGVYTCRKAEQNFIHTLGTLASSGLLGSLWPNRHKPAFATPSMVRVIVNDKGLPVLLQKHDSVCLGEKSALSLEPITVGNVIWPPGTIMSVSPVDTPVKSHRKPVIIPAQAIGSLGPMRLASFGLPVHERNDFALRDRKLHDAIRSTALDAFRQRARRAVDRA